MRVYLLYKGTWDENGHRETLVGVYATPDAYDEVMTALASKMDQESMEETLVGYSSGTEEKGEYVWVSPQEVIGV